MYREIIIESSIINLRSAEVFIESFARDTGIVKEIYGRVIVSVMEAVNNAIVHGNKNDISKRVSLVMELEDGVLKTTITDEGEGFKPMLLPDPTYPENIENIRGRGVFLMGKLSDKIEFNEKGNSVVMYFKLDEY